MIGIYTEPTCIHPTLSKHMYLESILILYIYLLWNLEKYFLSSVFPTKTRVQVLYFSRTYIHIYIYATYTTVVDIIMYTICNEGYKQRRSSLCPFSSLCIFPLFRFKLLPQQPSLRCYQFIHFPLYDRSSSTSI
jgi:hypothetical protein